MPLYEFDCPECGEPFEKRVGFSDDLSAITCPACGSTQVKKKLSSFAVKGSNSKAPANSSGNAGCSSGGT